MKRQGDILIVPITTLPPDVHQISIRVLAEGEKSGHLHQLDSGQVFEKEENLFFVVSPEETTTLSHPEHAPLEFQPGIYRVIRQREYTPEGWRHVSD